MPSDSPVIFTTQTTFNQLGRLYRDRCDKNTYGFISMSYQLELNEWEAMASSVIVQKLLFNIKPTSYRDLYYRYVNPSTSKKLRSHFSHLNPIAELL